MRGFWTRSVSMELVVKYGCGLKNGYVIGNRGSVLVVAVPIGYQLPVGCLKVRSWALTISDFYKRSGIWFTELLAEVC